MITLSQVDEFIAESAANFTNHGYGHWVLEALDGGRFIGYAGMRPVPEYNAPELLYSVEPAQWGSGIATEAARRLAGYALDELQLPRITADIDPPNIASGRVLEKIGMQRLGCFQRDGLEAICFEMKREGVR